MPYVINTVETKVFNQLTNGLTFSNNTGFFDQTFTGNVEKLRVQTVYEITWFAAADPYVWNVQAGIIESVGYDFNLQGFEVGQQFQFYNDWAIRQTDSPEFTATIDSIENNGSLIRFTVDSGTQTTVNPTITNVGIWADASEDLNTPASVLVKFGLPLQSENDSFESLLDGSVQRYVLAAYNNTGVQTLAPATTTTGQYTGGMTLEPTTATGKNALRLTFNHDLIVNPFYLETDSPDVLINPPGGDVKNIVSQDNVRFAAAECLRYVQEIELRSGYTNAKGRKQVVRIEGNTGWFQDNFNTASKQFELHESSVVFNGGTNTGLVFGQVNTIQFDIKASDGSDIPANSPFGVYFSILPPENRYQNQQTNFVSNWVYDCAVNDEGAAISAGENSLWSSVSGTLTTVASQEMIRVTATLDLTGTQAEYDDKYIIWAGCESPNADISDVACNATATAGGAGITDLSIALDPAGGIIIFDVSAIGQPDKFEIIHNGTKKATTSMLSVNNGGAFDPATDASGYDDSQWYIGTDLGTVPNFTGDFFAATGIFIDFIGAVQQRIWWQYTPADYATASTCILRATGTVGTRWYATRKCTP